MRFREILPKPLLERSFADVGLRGDKFYLAARPEHLNDDFFQTGILHGVKGISSSKTIWANFSPNVGRNVFFVMPAQDVVRMNRVTRVGYNDPEKLVANNSAIIGRILSIKDVARSQGDNLIYGCFPKLKIQGDGGTVTNNASYIADLLRKGVAPSTKYPAVDDASFGDYEANGLRLSSIADYANLYYQAAKAAGYYGTEYVRFFSPQNRSKWYPAVSGAVVRQANVYADEAEWLVPNETLKVPPSTQIVVAIPAKYADPEPADRDKLWWNDYDDKALAEYQALIAKFKASPFKVKFVEAGKTANQLDNGRARRRNAGTGQ
jgi:hypothetical protein